MNVIVLKVFDIARRRKIVLAKDQVEAIEEDAKKGCQQLAHDLKKIILLTMCNQVCKHVKKTASLTIIFHYDHLDEDDNIKVADIQVNVLTCEVITGTPDSQCMACIRLKILPSHEAYRTIAQSTTDTAGILE